MYRVIRNNYYHADTFDAPPDREIIRVCCTENAAHAVARFLNRTSASGCYVLAHGEYAVPHYSVESCEEQATKA